MRLVWAHSDRDRQLLLPAEVHSTWWMDVLLCSDPGLFRAPRSASSALSATHLWAQLSVLSLLVLEHKE